MNELLTGLHAVADVWAIFTLPLAVFYTIGLVPKWSRFRQKKIDNAAYGVLEAHLEEHRDKWEKRSGSCCDYFLTFNGVSLSFDFNSSGSDLYRCKLNGKVVPKRWGWKFHNAYSRNSAHELVKALKPAETECLPCGRVTHLSIV